LITHRPAFYAEEEDCKRQTEFESQNSAALINIGKAGKIG
jgi:hypothetical protein